MKEIINKLDDAIETLYTFLTSCNIKPKNKKLSTLVNHLNDVVAIRKNKKYVGVELDGNVIKSVYPVQGIFEDNDIPNDITRGYYYYNCGAYYLDKDLQKKLWEG